jgi:hypothetical protein
MMRWLELIGQALERLGLGFTEFFAFFRTISIAEALFVAIGVTAGCIIFLVTIGYLFEGLKKNRFFFFAGAIVALVAGYFVFDEAHHRWGTAPDMKPAPSITPQPTPVAPSVSSTCAFIWNADACNARADCAWSTSSNSCSKFSLQFHQLRPTPVAPTVAPSISSACTSISNPNTCNARLDCFWLNSSCLQLLPFHPLETKPSISLACAFISNPETCNARLNCNWSRLTNTCAHWP